MKERSWEACYLRVSKASGMQRSRFAAFASNTGPGQEHHRIIWVLSNAVLTHHHYPYEAAIIPPLRSNGIERRNTVVARQSRRLGYVQSR